MDICPVARGLLQKLLPLNTDAVRWGLKPEDADDL